VTPQDITLLALTAWRENRSGGAIGMQSVANVVINRVRRYASDAFTECTRAEQFSSISTAGDPELSLWPSRVDPQGWADWQDALWIAAQAAAGTLEDLTGGADLYYAPASLVTKYGHTFTLPNGKVIPFPDGWNENAVVYTCTIEDQVFFK
jgi:N-acetylmuramoyl-L-alanine amidase